MEIDEKKLIRRKDATGTPTQNKFNAETWRLSQSTMKAWQQTREGRLCPIVFKEYCLTNNLYSESGEAAKKGVYFEYMATGSVSPYDPTIPVPEKYQKSGTAGDGRQYFAGETKPEWIIPEIQANNFHNALKAMGMRIIDRGAKIAHDGAHGNLDLILQVDRDRWDEHVNSYLIQEMFTLTPMIASDGPTWEECTWRNSLGQVHHGCIVVDLKFTGLLYDKWQDAGWDLDRLSEKTDTLLQGKHYHWLSGGLPFFFWVFSAKDEDSKMIRLLFPPGTVEAHTQEVANAVKLIRSQMAMDSPTSPAFWTLMDGRKYVPTLKDCQQCPLRDECPKRATVPRIYAVQVHS